MKPQNIVGVCNHHLDQHEVSDFQRPFVLQQMLEKLQGQDPTMVGIPVDVEKFVNGDEYLNKPNTIYPSVMRELKELNSEGKYDEAVLTGGIGSGKTTIALYTTAYQLYRLSLFRNPHQQFGLDPTSEIVFIIQSLNFAAAKQVDFNRFRELIQQSHYFKTQFPFDKNIESKLVFPNRIEVQPVSGAETAAIGQNVIGGIIDELNYMAVVERSTSTRREGGTYDQAMALYNSISRRRGTRFMNADNPLPGMLCLPSSKRHPGEFTEVKSAEAKTNPRIFVYDKRAWEIAPSGRYTGKMFNLFVGDQFRRPRVLGGEDKVAPEDRDLVMRVPVEYRGDFDRDILSALREIAGVSTLALHPFLHNTNAVAKCTRSNLVNLSVEEYADFSTRKVKLRTKAMGASNEFYRWVHVDLGLTSDSAGICMGHVEKFVRVKRGQDAIELLPLMHIDLILEIAPPPNGEVNFAKIRELIYFMSKNGVPIRWVTYDSFQSRDSLQILRGRGYTTGLLSMDKTPVPYEVLKTGLYDTRVRFPRHDKLIWELNTLERDPKTGRVDHPANSSKDISDALAGVVYGLSTRLEVYAQHGVSPNSVPQWLVAQSGQANMETGQTSNAPDAVSSS